MASLQFITPHMPVCVFPTRTLTRKKRIKLEKYNTEWTEPLLEYNRQKAEAEANGTGNKEPHMLHMVTRVKPLSGRPWWEKEIIAKLGLDGKANHPVVHKNIPAINRRLREVSHLVTVLPITFPHGVPEDESDFQHTLLKSNGECIVKKKVEAFEPPSEEDDPHAKWRLNPETVKKIMAKKVRDKDVHIEYFPTRYSFKLSHDKMRGKWDPENDKEVTMSIKRLF